LRVALSSFQETVLPLKAKRLKGLRMNEVSGVDAPAHLAPGYLVLKALAGADPLADLDDDEIEALTKALMADENGDQVPNELIDSLTKALGAMPDAAKAQATALIAALGGDAGDDPVAKALADAITKANTERDEAVAKATAAEEALAKATGPAPAESEAEVLAKAMESWPEPVRKAWADQQERIAKAEAAAAEGLEKAETERDARVSAEYLTKAKGPDYAGLPASAETRATILREVDEKLSDVAKSELHRILKAASNLVTTEGADFIEYGGAGGDVSSAAGAQSALEKAADDIQAKEPTLNRAQAIVKAADAHPELAQAAQPQGGQN
jgi:hypothetical protein